MLEVERLAMWIQSLIRESVCDLPTIHWFLIFYFTLRSLQTLDGFFYYKFLVVWSGSWRNKWNKCMREQPPCKILKGRWAAVSFSIVNFPFSMKEPRFYWKVNGKNAAINWEPADRCLNDIRFLVRRRRQAPLETRTRLIKNNNKSSAARLIES